MKVAKEHRILLCPQAIKLLRPLIENASNGSDYLFPGNKPGAHLSNMALLQLLQRLERPDLTAHGFRSTFRDWARETTDYPREVAEAALAHTIRDKTEAACARCGLFEKRRVMMEHWGRYLSNKTG